MEKSAEVQEKKRDRIAPLGARVRMWKEIKEIEELGDIKKKWKLTGSSTRGARSLRLCSGQTG